MNRDNRDGLRSWQTAFGLTTSSVTAYTDRFHAERTVTTTSPDGSCTVTVSEEGRVKSDERKDATGQRLAYTTYQYDALGRPSSQTVILSEAKNLKAAFAYDVLDRQIAVTNAVGLAEEQITQFQYDVMGRRTVTTLPDNAHTYVAYLPTGEVSTNWGDRTYPVAYTYDHAGRMQTMTTWTNFAGNAGAAVTTWNYDANSGQLTSKRYQDDQGPDYTYTSAGRLQTRTWARGVVTTYGYNNAGDLWTVAYSDNTPWVTNTYNRLGRRVAASSATDAVSYSYNAAGQLLAEAHTAGPLAGLVVTNSYDSLLRRSAVAVQSSGSSLLTPVSFGYDSASRLQTVSAGTLSAAYAYVPNAPGLVNSIVFRSAGAPMMTTTKTTDNLNRLTEISSVKPDLSTVNRHLYTYSAANQRTKRTDADNSYWANAHSDSPARPMAAATGL